jgi:protein phosphatase
VPKLTSFGKTDKGPKRLQNEDAFVVKSELGICLVADGMGGAAAGELASRIFVETALEVFTKNKAQSEQERRDLVQAAFSSAHQRIQDCVKENPHYRGMGCTAELVVFYNKSCLLGHVGDSRTYLFRNGQLKQLTHDHSLVQDQIDRGLITVADARKHPQRNVILRAVGVDDSVGVDILRGTIVPGDIFLLCSDGLTDMVNDEAIEGVLSSPQSVHQKVEELVELAKSKGGYDNITVILSKIEALS